MTVVMSTKSKVISNKEHNVYPSCNNSNLMEDFADGDSTSYRLHTSQNSTISNESEVSLLSLSLANDLDASMNAIDELPAFEIRLISPIGRSPSPIDNEDIATPTSPFPSTEENINNAEFIALKDINAQISPPCDDEKSDPSPSRKISLETIYEGIFLNTPPRQRVNIQSHQSRTCVLQGREILLEKVASNRLNMGKENQSP